MAHSRQDPVSVSLGYLETLHGVSDGVSDGVLYLLPYPIFLDKMNAR